MRAWLNKLTAVMTIIATIIAAFTAYSQYQDNNPTIEIKKLSIDILTKTPKVSGLNAKYLYKDKEVKSLWKLNYLITNIGRTTIVGEGNQKNIIKDKIEFYLSEKFNILEVNSNERTPFHITKNKNKIYISFLQWKPTEKLNITIYAEELNKTKEPKLLLNDREIINGVVKYSSILEDIKNENTVFFYKLPNYIQKIIYWISIICYSFMLIAVFFMWLGDLIKYIKYKNWEKNNKEKYKKFIDKLIIEGKVDKYIEPKDLYNYELWREYEGAIPPLIFDLKNTTSMFIFVLFISIIPLLLLI